MEISLKLPLSKEQVRTLRSGDSCLLSGVIYTARDAAHKRLCDSIAKGEPLPIELENSAFYFAGPAPAKPGHIIGSVGPTTSYRMDDYSPILIEKGQTVMIGKGRRSTAVKAAMKCYGAVYFGAIGGCGALLSQCIKSCAVVAYDDLGTEAIRRLEVENFPAVVVVDAQGNDLYETGVQAYLKAAGKENDF